MHQYNGSPNLGRYLANTPQIDIVIEGHTDNTGTERFNDGLSMRRADMVKNILLEQQVSLAAIYTRGYGEHYLACTNQTPQGRACNRRVELLMIMDSQ
ncbi:OmpA family protein [Vibrio metschnikovii]